jgi:hypothetical protein
MLGSEWWCNTIMGESRQSITADCDIVHFLSHTGDDRMEDWDKVAEEVGGMSDNGRLKGNGKALS